MIRWYKENCLPLVSVTEVSPFGRIFFFSFFRSFVFLRCESHFPGAEMQFFYHFILPLPGTAPCCSVVSEIGFRKIFIDCVFARLSFIYSVAFTLIRSFGEGRKTKKGNHGGQLYPN